jgi:hypothetical protein
VDEIRDYIGADSLDLSLSLSLKGLKKACGEGEKISYCSACYTSNRVTLDHQFEFPARRSGRPHGRPDCFGQTFFDELIHPMSDRVRIPASCLILEGSNEAGDRIQEIAG